MVILKGSFFFCEVSNKGLFQNIILTDHIIIHTGRNPFFFLMKYAMKDFLEHLYRYFNFHSEKKKNFTVVKDNSKKELAVN